MVRLKADYPFYAFVAEIKFQFHYGSIKGLSVPVGKTHIESFQFHYGSIKGPTQKTPKEERKKFQFHYGSIKGNHAVMR